MRRSQSQRRSSCRRSGGPACCQSGSASARCARGGGGGEREAREDRRRRILQRLGFAADEGRGSLDARHDVEPHAGVEQRQQIVANPAALGGGGVVRGIFAPGESARREPRAQLGATLTEQRADDGEAGKTLDGADGGEAGRAAAGEEADEEGFGAVVGVVREEDRPRPVRGSGAAEEGVPRLTQGILARPRRKLEPLGMENEAVRGGARRDETGLVGALGALGVVGVDDHRPPAASGCGRGRQFEQRHRVAAGGAAEQDRPGAGPLRRPVARAGEDIFQFVGHGAILTAEHNECWLRKSTVQANWQLAKEAEQ